MAADTADSRRVLHTVDSVRASTSVDGLVLLDLAGGLVFSANPVGACVWRLIERGFEEHVISRQVADDFGVAIERAQRDVAAFIDSLIARGVVVQESATS